MPLFVQNKEGIVEMHASDCETCDIWTQGTVSEPEPDIEEIIAKAAGCSLVAWQSMTEEEGDKQLKKACKRRARAQRQRGGRSKRNCRRRKRREPQGQICRLCRFQNCQATTPGGFQTSKTCWTPWRHGSCTKIRRGGRSYWREPLPKWLRH